MKLLISGVLCALVSITSAGWLRDLISPKGLDAGDGLVLHLHDSQLPNTSFLERHTLKMDYGGYRLSLGKALRSNAVEVGFYSRDRVEGRGKGDYDHEMMSVLIGYKMATVVTMTLSAIGALVLKAMGIAKIAGVISVLLLVMKLFHHHDDASKTPAYVEIEHAPEIHAGYADFAPTGGSYDATDASSYYSYANYIPPGMVTNSVDYSAAETSVGNTSLATLTGNQQVTNAAVRRRDITRKKNVIPLLTIHKYSIRS